MTQQMPTYPIVARIEKATGKPALFMRDSDSYWDDLTCFTHGEGHTTATLEYFRQDTIPCPWPEALKLWDAYLKIPGGFVDCVPRLYKRFPTHGNLTYTK